MLKSNELLSILKTTELFSHVPDEILVSIQDRMEQFRLSAGTILFNESEPGDGLYIIVQGQLRILSGGVQLGVRSPGQYVGELALLDDSPRSATVKAKTDVLLLKLHRDAFHQVLTTSPELVSAMFRLLVQKIRNDTEHRTAILQEHEQVQYDLRRAHEIQTAMLPSEDLILDWLHLTGKSQPAAVVGGDYYDYFCLPDNRVSVAIGDVAGHGFYSSLLVAIVSSALQFQVEIDPTPASVHAVLNKVVRNYRHTRLLMTFSYMVLSPSDHTLTVTNAGHPYLYLYRHREQRWAPLEIDSLPLGTLLPVSSQQMVVEWEPGDRLFLYSDGLPEARNERGQPYGFDSLEHFLSQQASLSPNEMISILYETLDHYRKGHPFDDDVTAIVVKFRHTRN